VGKEKRLKRPLVAGLLHGGRSDMLPFAVCESRHTEQAPLTLDALSLRSLGALVVLTKLILGIIHLAAR
jgi:hypothetical protein